VAYFNLYSGIRLEGLRINHKSLKTVRVPAVAFRSGNFPNTVRSFNLLGACT
jgi:hypothetical protein